MLLGDEVDVEASFEEKSVAVNEAEDDELGDESLLDRVIQLKNPTVNTNFFITTFKGGGGGGSSCFVSVLVRSVPYIFKTDKN